MDGEGPEDEAELAARAAEDEARREVEEKRLGEVSWTRMLRAIVSLAALFGIDENSEWELADDTTLNEEFDPWHAIEQMTELMRIARRAPTSGLEIDSSTLAALHQFLATLSGPEASRAQALRAQLPAVPS